MKRTWKLAWRCNPDDTKSTASSSSNSLDSSGSIQLPKRVYSRSGEWLISSLTEVMPSNDSVIISTAENSTQQIPEICAQGNSNDNQLPDYYPAIQGSRSVDDFEIIHRISEGTYGVVYKAKDKQTDEIVALKRFKLENCVDDFPITALREINLLMKCQHDNVVAVREIVVDNGMERMDTFLVMDYIELDLEKVIRAKNMNDEPFLDGEVKCLVLQLLRGVGYMHDNWILHRDLKTSNLLLSHKGILKITDFSLSREYGSPLKGYTNEVVTLWYRAPELLLGSANYCTPIDMWSVGCIFGELLHMGPVFPGKSEIDQLHTIFEVLGSPTDDIWPGYSSLPVVQNIISQYPQFSKSTSIAADHFSNFTSESGLTLLLSLLAYDPDKRWTVNSCLQHGYFQELPLVVDPSKLTIYPSQSVLWTKDHSESDLDAWELSVG